MILRAIRRVRNRGRQLLGAGNAQKSATAETRLNELAFVTQLYGALDVR